MHTGPPKRATITADVNPRCKCKITKNTRCAILACGITENGSVLRKSYFRAAAQLPHRDGLVAAAWKDMHRAAVQGTLSFLVEVLTADVSFKSPAAARYRGCLSAWNLYFFRPACTSRAGNLTCSSKAGAGGCVMRDC